MHSAPRLHSIRRTDQPGTLGAAAARLIGSATLVIGLSAIAHSHEEGDWPHWRGPNRDGISTESNWTPEGREKPLWSRSVGRGYSNVCISGGRLFTMGFDAEAEADFVFCLDPETGEELWSFAYEAQLMDNMHEGGTLTTPVAEGERVYLLSRMGFFYCLDAGTGDVLWDHSVTEEFGVEIGSFGLPASPLLLEEMVVINVGRAVALDKETGKTIWATEDYGYAYAVPATMEVDGRALLVVPNDIGYVVLDRRTGEEVARHEVDSVYHTQVATPIVMGSRFFVSTGFDGGSCAMLELTDEGIEVVWGNKRMLNKMTGCVLIDDHLYGFDDAVLKCLDLDGNEAWRERGLGTGALSAAAGRLIVLSEKGELLIAPATPAGFAPQARSKVFEEGVCWTSPVLSKGRIFCRNNRGEIVVRNHRVNE